MHRMHPFTTKSGKLARLDPSNVRHILPDEESSGCSIFILYDGRAVPVLGEVDELYETLYHLYFAHKPTPSELPGAKSAGVSREYLSALNDERHQDISEAYRILGGLPAEESLMDAARRVVNERDALRIGDKGSSTIDVVVDFARAMEAQLARSPHKGGREEWLKESAEDHLAAVETHLSSARRAMDGGAAPHEVRVVVAQAANRLVMAFDTYAHDFPNMAEKMLDEERDARQLDPGGMGATGESAVSEE